MSAPADAVIAPLAEADLAAVAALAREIWYRHYPGIITVRQIDYMLDQRYRPEVIRAQLASGNAWWVKLEVAGRLAGFAQYQLGEDPASMKIDKLYVHLRYRGSGFGSALIRHVEQAARARGCSRLYLQVNKNNTGSIAAYERNGFAVAKSVKVDIGGGYFMDDYVMDKNLGHEARDAA
ncbi:MAG TPA: GNAT family N-acetyltransferase [Burkholderiales bacterium]|nr:GNAT family N-acetyltransferase [Burkholderiales bacterium]